jgi:hypothetical protein
LIKFRNYGIEAYAIFRGGEMNPILRCIRCIERKEMIYQVIMAIKGSTIVIITDTPKKREIAKFQDFSYFQ